MVEKIMKITKNSLFLEIRRENILGSHFTSNVMVGSHSAFSLSLSLSFTLQHYLFLSSFPIHSTTKSPCQKKFTLQKKKKKKTIENFRVGSTDRWVFFSPILPIKIIYHLRKNIKTKSSEIYFL